MSYTAQSILKAPALMMKFLTAYTIVQLWHLFAFFLLMNCLLLSTFVFLYTRCLANKWRLSASIENNPQLAQVWAIPKAHNFNISPARSSLETLYSYKAFHLVASNYPQTMHWWELQSEIDSTSVIYRSARLITVQTSLCTHHICHV